MICPHCHGTGWGPSRPTSIIDVALQTFAQAQLVEPCTHPGCHNGIIHCCEGDADGTAGAAGRKCTCGQGDLAPYHAEHCRIVQEYAHQYTSDRTGPVEQGTTSEDD